MESIKYDKQITISAAGSRRAARWPSQQMMWSELVEKLKTPTRSTETLAEYLDLPKKQQDELKDVGGFVGGTLTGGRRKVGCVQGRDIITLDLDHIPAGKTQDMLRRIEGLGCAYAVYSTRKHEEAKPRLRVLVVTDRTMTADEYEAVARKLAEIIGIDCADPTTFEAHRLMYWPSCCVDSTYVYQYGDKPFLLVDGMLALYQDWRNMAEWPQTPREKAPKKPAGKQSDPLSKKGVVGAFCRVYDVYKAMETYLPGVYEPCTGMESRYTYTGGSTVGGAIVYDGGRFLYSHHATDPCGGQLVNAFDLVRLHRFVDRDDEAKPGTLPHQLPSFKAMCELAVADEAVTALQDQERYEEATAAFTAPGGAPAPDDGASWMAKLKRSAATGAYAKTTANVLLVLENDPLLKGRIRENTFTGRIIGTSPLPWGARKTEAKDFQWEKKDDSGLRIYIEKVLGFKSRDTVEDALYDYAAAHGFNPVAIYLNSLEWDGVPRLDTIYIDYLGAEDCAFIRTITRKAFVAAIARAMTQSGVKFDWMTVVCGREGIGKSTLFSKLGKEWFTDSIKTFEGKEAEEIIEGRWIVEIAELQALNKADINRVKQFLSKVGDQYRAAYGRHVKTQIRRCVFFGTTNDHEYLRDPTGGRRFWPVDAHVQAPTKDIFRDLDGEIDQIWAEAVMRWRLGESLFLSKEMEKEAKERRKMHLERDPLQGQIEEFVEKKVPSDWQKWPLHRRIIHWNGEIKDETKRIKLVPRDRICALEIWKECLGERRLMTKADSHRINTILQSLPGWEPVSLIRFGVDYGRQRGYKRNISVI